MFFRSKQTNKGGRGCNSQTKNLVRQQLHTGSAVKYAQEVEEVWLQIVVSNP